MSSSRMVDTMAESSSDPSCSSCAKLKEALEASKKEHSLTLRMVKEKIISTDELIKKYQQKCHESDKHQQQSTDTALKLEAAQMKLESLQSQLDRSLHSSEPLRKNVARLHREKSLADSTIIELREKLQNFEKTNSQLLSTVKIKEEQECAWRLEKQVQADEMHKQKKSLQKSEATITKLQEEIKKEKEKNKELNKLLSQAKRKATKMEQQLQKSKEEMESVKLEAEFAKALEEDLTKKTSKPRQRQKARQPPRQPPVELKQTSPSASHPNQQLAHIIEELTVLSDMEPALSPLPPSPDREGLGDSSISEEESGSGSSSEDDGSEIEDEDSDYSLGDLADMLIGEHGENLAAGTIKTRSSDQDVHEDAENSSGGETKTKNVIDCAKPENESSARQSPNEGNSSDVEFSENLSIVNCDVANTENKVSKTLKMNQESTGIEAEMNENLHITESDSSDRRKTDDECAKTKEPSNTEKCAVVTPSPQRKAKQRIASPKPHVMTRSRAKAMKLSSSSDAESSSERESGMEVIQTQETSAEVSDTGLKRNSNATDIGTSNDGGSGNNEHVSSDALVDNKNEFTESSQAKESQAHVEGFLSDSSSYDADDVAHHHGNLFEAVCSKTSLADLQDQEPTEDTSNVLLVGAEADVLNYQRNNGQLSCSATLLTDVEEQVDNEDNSDAFLRMDTNATHQQRDDSDVSCSGALLTNSEIRAGDEDNSNALVGMDTNATHQQRDDSDVSCSGALLTNSEIRAGDEDNSNALVGMDTNATHQQRDDSDVSCSGALLTNSEIRAGDEDNSNALVGMDTNATHQQRDDSDVSCSGALLTNSEIRAGDEDNSNALVGMDTNATHQQRDDSDVSCSGALLTNSEIRAGDEDNSNALVGMDTNATHQQRDDSDVSCSGALLTNSEIRAGDEDNSNALVGMDTNATHQQKNDSDVSCSGALLTDSEKQAGNEDNLNVLTVGMDADTISKQRQDSDVSYSGALLTDSEKQAGNEDNFNVLTVGMDADTISQQRQDSDVSCSEALLTDSEKQAGNENHSDVFTGGQEVNGSRLGHSTGLLSEQVTIEDSSDETSVPVSKAAANTSTEVTIDNEQQFSSTSESGSEIKSSASLNMTKEESSNITEIPSLQLNNENCTTVLVNKIITEKSTEEIQTSQDNKITADVNGTTLLLQSETKENTFHRGEDTLEENNNDVSEGFEASHEQVGSALEVDADSYDQTQSFVPKNYNQSTCTTEIKTSDGSEVSSTCDGTKKEHRLKEQLYFPSDEESDVDSFPCVVPGKVPKSAETSKGEPADVISSTVEVDVNQSTVTCEKETTIPTASTAETTQWSSIKGHEVESSKDNKLTLEEGGHSRTSDEAMESCSTDEHERKDSKGQDSSVTENFPVLTSESSLKDSELDKGESFISDGEQFSSCNDERKNSDFVKVKDVLASKPVTEEANEPSTSNDGRKNSDFVNVNDVPTSKIVIEEANEPSTSNDGSKNFDLVKVIKDVPTSKTVIEEANEPSTSNDGRKNSDFVNVKDVPASKTVSEEPNQPSTSNDGRKNSDLVKVNIDVPTSKTVIEKANEPSTSTDGRNNSDLVKVKDVLASKTVTEEANEPSTSNDGRKNSDFVKVKDVPTSKTVIEEAIGPSASNDGRKNSDCVKGAPACKTAIKDARDPLTPNAGREESHSGRDLSSTAMTKNRSSTSNDEKRHFVKKKDLSSRNTSNERSSTVHEGRKNSDMGKAVSFTAMCKEGSSPFNDEKRHFDNKEYLSSRNTSNERSVVHEVVHEGRKRSVMGNDVPVTATRKESCSVLNEGEKNSTLGRDVSSRVVSNESCSSFNVGRRNSDLGRRVCPRIITEEGSSSSKEGRNYSECEKEMLPYVREPSTLITERKPCVNKRDVSSARTVAEKAGIRKGLSPPQLDVNESKLEEGGKSLELPWSSNDKGPSDDFPAACDPMDDSPIEISFNNLECLLEEFPALSPLPPSPCRSDDEECSTSLISSNNLNKESSNRVTDLTPTKKTFDASGKPELRRGRTLNCTEVASRTVKRTSLEKTATMCVTESNKGNISATPRTRLAKEKANESASTPCLRRNASMKRPLQRPVSASPCAAEIISLKRSYQQSVCEPVDNTDAVSQKIKKIRTQPNIPDKNETSSLEKRLHMSTIPVKKATCSQPSKKNGATKGSILVNGKGPILAGRKNPKLAGNKEPIRADRKGPILVGDKEPILVDADGPILEFNEKPVLEDKSNNPNTGNSAKVTKQDRYRPLSIRPGYMPEVKYMFKCLSRVHEDNVDLHVVVARLTTKRCISSSTPVASAIIQFLKEREDDLIPLILDQLGRFKTDGSLNNWQPVISSFESRLLEVVSLLSSDTLFGNLIPRLVSLCSRSLTEACCSSNDEEVTKGELSLCRVLTALCQLKKSLFCARTVCYDVIRSLYRAQNAALELVVTMITVWPEVLKSSSACSRGQQSPLAQTLKLVLLYWAETYTSGDLGNVLRVLCCWEDDLVTEEELKRFGLQLIQSFRGERVEASVVLGKDGSMVLDRHSFEVVKSLELLSCVLGWQWTLNEVIVNNVWQILKSWAEKERRDEPTANGSQPHAASCSEENTVSACFCSDFNVSKEVSSVTVLADKETSSRSGFRTAGEKKEERNQVGGEDEVPEICSKCGKLTRRGLPESQAVLCIQLLGVLCRIAIDNGQTAVHEITNMLCGLMEDSSPTSKSRVTYAVQLASAISLLDMSPWQPERVAVVLSKWVTALKESGSLQAPANVAQGLVCLKSFLRINQT